MKTKVLVNKLLLASAGAFLCIFCLSWKPDKKSALNEFLSSNDFSAKAKITGTAESNLKKLLQTRYFKAPLTMKKKIGYPTIYWSLWQESSPYRDGNIHIALDGVQKVFDFWTNNGSFGTCDITNVNSPDGAKTAKSCIEECGALVVSTPIYEAWVGTGFMHLDIYSWDGSNWTNEYHGSEPRGPLSTPDYTTTFVANVNVCYGYDYYVYAWADVY